MMVVNLGVVAGGAVVGAQLEPGPVATPFEHRPIGTELALCQRYYFAQSSVSSTYKGHPFRSDATTERGFTIFLPQEMRAVPTVDVTVTGGTLANTFPTSTSVGVRMTATATNSSSAAVSAFTADAEL